MLCEHPQLAAGEAAPAPLRRGPAGAGGPGRPTAAAPACQAAGRDRAAHAARPRGQARAHFAHERARLELPGTSANAWRTRSAAAGFPRALSSQAPRGREDRRGGVGEQDDRAPGRRPRPPLSAAQPGACRVGARVQAVAHQHEPRGRQAPDARSRAAGSPRPRRGPPGAAWDRAPPRRSRPSPPQNQSSV